MNFIIKTIIKKVFQKYLNLEQQLNVQSGHIKLPYGKINHVQINKKLQPFGIQISESVYKNLSISIPITEIVSKPIKISIQRFQVLIGKRKKQKKQNQQEKQENSSEKKQNVELNEQKVESNEKIVIEQEVNKYSKSLPSGKQQVSSGYIKNMVNRLLYNMQIIFEKIVIRMQKDEDNQSKQGLNKYLQDVEFEITNLHLRNSLVLLEANIIKKIFNLQQILIKHKFAELIIKDFNICLDYNNKNFNIMAILESIFLNIKTIPHQEIQKMLKKNLKKPNLNSQSEQKKIKHTSQKQHKTSKKSINLDIYVKINQSNFQIQNLVSLKGQMLEVKYKNLHQTSKNSHIGHEKNIEIELLFKNLYVVHLNEQPFEQKDFIIIRYLPWCTQVKTFSEYEDNILKSALLKFSLNETHRREFVKPFNFKKNQEDINSSTSFQQKGDDGLMNDFIRKEMKVNVYYLDAIVDLQVAKRVIQKILKDKQLKRLFQLLSVDNQPNKKQSGRNEKVQPQQVKEMNQKIEIITDILFYRFMVSVRLINEYQIKIYGSFKGDYSNNFKYSHTDSFTESSVYGRHSVQVGNNSQYGHSHAGKHTHKKKVSNKQKYSKLSLPQNQQQKISSKVPEQHKRSSRIHEHQPDLNQKVQIFHFQFIQLCLQCRNYRIIDLGKLQLTYKKNAVSIPSQIVIGGTSLNTQLSIKLITDIIKLVPVIQKQAKIIKFDIQSFLNIDIQNIQNQSKNSLPESKIQISDKKKSKISLFLKMNELNIKFGSLIKKPQNEIRERILRKQDFIWIVLIQMTNIIFGTKSFQSYKVSFETMIYLSSPQTLHKSSITKNPVQFKIERNRNKQIVISLNNDLQLDLNEDNIQILVKYIGSIGQNMQIVSQDRNSHKLSDNSCCFIEFYNSLQKDIEIIQANEYQVSEDSINLQEFQQENKNFQKDSSKMQQKVNHIDKQSNQLLFLLNQYCVTVKIDGHKSYPVSLEFTPIFITNSKTENIQFQYQYQELLRFQDHQKMENKYVLQFLLNSIRKIEKIILKNNVCLMTYGNMMTISHQNSQNLAYSNIILNKMEQKITDQLIVNSFRTQKYISCQKAFLKKDFDVNFQFLLDINEQSKEIILQKGDDQQNIEKLKVSSMLLRSPNSKAQNSLYSLFGVYRETQLIKDQSDHSNSTINRLLQSYLYQIKHLKTYYFVELPFLIIQNNLSCLVQLDIFDKKSQSMKSLKFNPKQKKDIHPGTFGLMGNSASFDFYNKQFTIKVKLISKKKSISLENQQLNQQIFYESQEHYFNTFFMVEHDFQTLITLKSNQKYQFDKKYIFLKQELMLKTKVLKLEPSCRIVNKTNFNFGLKFRRNQGQISSQIKSPKKGLPSQNQSDTKNQPLVNYIIIDQEEQNNHIFCSSNTQVDIINQFRQNQVLQVLFNNMQQTKIQVLQQSTKEGNILVLSFNFAQNDIKIIESVGKRQKYCHLLFRLRSKYVDNHQFLILQNFITFKNLSSEKISLSLEPQKTIAQNDEVIFALPPTINNKFNNRVIVMNNITEMQLLYEELFSFGLSNSAKNIKSPKNNTKQKIDFKNIKGGENYYLLLKNQSDNQQYKVSLQQLLYSKNNVKQVNLNQKGIKLFSLLKDIKNGIIRLFFLEKLFNPNINYLLFNNSTSKNFLISNDNSEYTHHFLKSSSQKNNLFDIKKDEKEEETTQKIFIQKNTFSTLSSKDDFQLFLCDQNGKHLQKSTKNNLQKQGLQMEFHTTGNLQLIDIFEIPRNKQKQGKQQQKQAKISVKTRLISLNVNLYSKLFLNFSISAVSVRLLEENKVDCLVQDISLKNCLSNQHILRIPEQSYFLFEGKTFGNEKDSKFVLIKNLFIKCKNIILNLQKDLSYRIISLCKNLLPDTNKWQDKQLKKKYFDNEGIRLLFESIEANESLDKLKKYLKQNLFLVKNIYLHEIHLSLSLDLENNNFSNVMVIPQYQLVNSFMRESNLLKEVGEYYKTNVLAKLPKLSFVFQNIKNPLNLLRTMMKVNNALNQKIELKNVLTFDHDEIPENDLQFSLQRWNLIHRKNFAQFDIDSNQNEPQELLTYLYKNQTYYLISNKSFIVISLNSRNIPKQAEQTFVHYQSSSEQSLGSYLNKKWFRTYQNAMMRVMSLKDLEKIKLIRNKKYSQLVVQFKRNISFNICDEYEKCSRVINTLNSIVM